MPTVREFRKEEASKKGEMGDVKQGMGNEWKGWGILGRTCDLVDCDAARNNYLFVRIHCFSRLGILAPGYSYWSIRNFFPKGP